MVFSTTLTSSFRIFLQHLLTLILCIKPISCFSQVQKTETVQESYSQAAQDQFVTHILYDLLNKKDLGYYLEIGAGHPIEINNSYLLEKSYSWKGISIDISEEYLSNWNLRKNPLLVKDALKIDYEKLLEDFPQSIDYLSLDIDEHYDVVLKKLPLNKHIFKIITIEHDSYRFGNIYKQSEREILSSHGYILICEDVSFREGYPYEDWWVHSSILKEPAGNQILQLKTKDTNFSKIVKKFQKVKPGKPT